MENGKLAIGKYILWLVLILLIAFRYFSSRPVYKNGDTIRVTSVIFSDPIIYGNYQRISVAGLKVYLPVFPEIYYGDRVVIEGVVKDGKLENPKLVLVSPSSGFGSGLRNSIVSFYEKSLPQPISGLVAGITLGSKRSLTSDFWQKVKNTGVAHVVVASGTNVTFVVSFVFAIAAMFLSRHKSIPFVLLNIILYLFLSGFDAPLIRAAIMSLLTFWAQSSGRLANAWKVLILTAGIMLAVQPDWVTDIGFILSFVSTASIMFFGRKISMYLKYIPKFLREDFSTTLAAQIGVSPILFVTFGQFNILSPIINLLVLWTVPFIMILGSLGGAVGLVFPTFGKLILYISYPLGWWFVTVVKFFD